MSDDPLKESFARLKNPNLLENLVHDMGKAGIVGEPGNVVSIIIAFNSLLCQHPLNLSPGGVPGIGKSYLICAVSEIFSSVSLVSGYLSKTSLIHDTDWAERVDEKYILDLTGRVIILLEAESSQEFLNLMKPIRSHDKREISFNITEGTGGKHSTKKVIIRGWPVFIAISVNRSSKPEDSTRDLSITPSWSEKKGKAVNRRTALMAQMPWKYPSDKELEESLGEWDFALTKYLKPAKVMNIWAIAFANDFDAKNERTMRDFNKLISIFQSIVLLHQYQRIIIELKNGDRCVIGTIDDLKILASIARTLIEPTTRGIGKDVIDFHDNFFSKVCPDDNTKLTIKEVREAYFRHYHRSIGRTTLLEHYLYPLHDIGQANKDESEKAHKWSASSVGLSESVGIDFDRLVNNFDIEAGIRHIILDLISSVGVSRVFHGDNPIHDTSTENIIQEALASIQSTTIRQEFLIKLRNPLASCLKNEDIISVGNEKTVADISDRSSDDISILNSIDKLRHIIEIQGPLSMDSLVDLLPGHNWQAIIPHLIDDGTLQKDVGPDGIEIFQWLGGRA